MWSRQHADLDGIRYRWLGTISLLLYKIPLFLANTGWNWRIWVLHSCRVRSSLPQVASHWTRYRQYIAGNSTSTLHQTKDQDALGPQVKSSKHPSRREYTKRMRTDAVHWQQSPWQRYRFMWLELPITWTSFIRLWAYPAFLCRGQLPSQQIIPMLTTENSSSSLTPLTSTNKSTLLRDTIKSLTSGAPQSESAERGGFYLVGIAWPDASWSCHWPALHKCPVNNEDHYVLCNISMTAFPSYLINQTDSWQCTHIRYLCFHQ
jgi:hypothetical protein